MVFTCGEGNAPIRFMANVWLNEFEEASIIDGAIFVDGFSLRLPSDVRSSDAIMWPLGDRASFSKIRPLALITRRRETELLVALAR